MSTHECTVLRLPRQKPVFLTAKAAARLIGCIAPQTFAKLVEPDAWYSSIKGDKEYPLWSRETAEAFRMQYTVEVAGGAE